MLFAETKKRGKSTDKLIRRQKTEVSSQWLVGFVKDIIFYSDSCLLILNIKFKGDYITVFDLIISAFPGNHSFLFSNRQRTC